MEQVNKDTNKQINKTAFRLEVLDSRANGLYFRCKDSSLSTAGGLRLLTLLCAATDFDRIKAR